ncbi:hypothetical protein ACH5RR_013298 [Cinchona calisaya]|uniref:Uncharacterized protein n=1 Tax=Cinchona calisaya TaxID=153742 RepID=A0ABD2ZZN1_9GENT
MGTVYEELDEANVEIEKLRADYGIKLEFSENLKRAHNEQLIKLQEANLKVNKLSQQLNEKAEEISIANQMCEELKSKLKEKEAVIKHLTCANDKLRADCKEKLRSSEEENRGLALALDEANAKSMDQEQLIRSLKVEVDGMKGIVSISQNKCLEVDRKHKAFQEMRRGEDVLLKLEDEKSKYENQLKWKKEQFGHLEEAHMKLQHEFKVSEKEWKKERASLLDEISRLQTNLDSQTRISESLQGRLQMCNQALAHEESKRKYLEVQLSESKTNFNSVFAEYEEAKSTIESLTGQRDKEIASLRNSLGTRESIYKEMEYQVRMLEQEKQELMVSLKELQEAQIREGGGSASSLTKLRNKLRSLEQVHKDCSARLKSKEAEWHSQLGVLMEKLNSCISELQCKNILIDQLQIKAEAHDSMIVQLALHNEEAAVMVLVLKLGLFEAQIKLADAYVDLDYIKKERNESLSLFRGLEEVHKDCSVGLKSKEAEWNSQLEFLAEKLKCCSSELDRKNVLIDQLKMEAEVHDSMVEQLALLNQEAAFNMLLLKSGFQEAYNKLAESYADLDEKNMQSKEKETHLLAELEMKSSALTIAQSDAEEERKKVAHLSEKVESVTFIEEQKLLQHKELERLEKLLNESNTCHCELKRQVLSMNSELKEVCSALSIANEELDEKVCRGMEFEFQMQIWNSFSKELKTNLEKDHQSDAEEEHKKIAHLSEKVESVTFIEEQKLLQHKELERLEKLLNESNTCQCELKRQVLSMNSELKEVCSALRIANEELDEKVCRGMEFEFQMQIWNSFSKELKTNLEKDHQMHGEMEASLQAQLLSLKSDLKKVRKTLSRANEELTERFCQANEAEFELQIWKSIAEQLKANLEEYHQMRKEVEASLLAEVAIEVNLRQEKEGHLIQLEEKDKRIEDLHEQIALLNQELETIEKKDKTPACTNNEKFYSSRISVQSADCNSDDYQEEEEWVKRELEGAILAQVDAKKNYEHEKEGLHHLVEERDQRIEDLQQLVKSLEQEFESSTSSFSSKLSDMQLEINLFNESWHMLTTALFLKETEIQEKNLIILELENDLTDLETGSQASSKSEVERLRGELEEEQRTSDLLIQKLNDEKGKIIEDVANLSSDRENLLNTLDVLSDRMHKLSMDDLQLMDSLRNKLHNFDSIELEIDFKGEDAYFDPVKENKNHYASPRTTKAEAMLDERLPLRALNNGLYL